MTDSFNITIKGLDDLQKKAQQVGSEMTMKLTQAMIVSTKKIKDGIQNKIIDEGITFQGTLGGSVSVIQANSSQGIVGVGELYGAAVEFGSRPHFPPPKALERWAAIKLGQPGLGFVIARKIARVGTKAHPFVEPTFQSNIDFVKQQFEDVAAQIIVDMGD